ncbi:hypothetical protein GCM10011506_15510 [Marivirga lumbricoides]|uniref:Uncharacterized protein n=1 Tax=Marivirga lumbricoides TaxID=1046115 RepID=A0A2T4DFA5_9BACT|nr:hypothetical protein C9994_13910 [Marivirga lumbricoides]GGC30994.1 hypothetical protein GCM10011506_15510 [Marivirga lumbricoides]
MKAFFQYIAENPDYIILACSSAFLVSYFIRWVFRNNNNSDDDEGGGGGGSSNGTDDPVLDLPPGVCLPKDKNEPELV